MLQKPSYLGVSKTVKYRIHVLELNQQSQKKGLRKSMGLGQSMVTNIFSEKSMLHIDDLQDLGISEDLQDKTIVTKMSVFL